MGVIVWYRLFAGIHGAGRLLGLRGVAIDAGVSPGDHEPGDVLGVMDRHVEADDSAVAVAENGRALDPQLAHQLDRILGHVVIVELAVRGVGGAPVSHLLHRDHLEVGRKERDQLRIRVDRTRPTVE